jgi:hypothetical protein
MLTGASLPTPASAAYDQQDGKEILKFCLETSLVYGIKRSLTTGGELGIASVFQFPTEKTKEWRRWISPGSWTGWAASFVFRADSPLVSAIKGVTDLVVARCLSRAICQALISDKSYTLISDKPYTKDTFYNVSKNLFYELSWSFIGFVLRTSLMYGCKRSLTSGGKEGIITLASLPPKADPILAYLPLTPYFTFVLGNRGWVKTMAGITEVMVASCFSHYASHFLSNNMGNLSYGLNNSR